jgi:hypothetical protein
VFTFLVNNAVAASKARDIRSNIRIAAVSRENALVSSNETASDAAKHNQLMQEIAALRSQLNAVQADSATFCRLTVSCCSSLNVNVQSAARASDARIQTNRASAN